MKKIRHIGWLVERCRTGLLERIFAESWLKENNLDKRHGINLGLGVLQELFMKAAPAWWARHGGAKIVINQRDAFVAATVIQWLGTNCGFCFLQECLRKAGYRIVPTKEKRDRYYSRQTQDGNVVVPSAWHNFAQDHSVFFDRDRAPIQEYEVDYRALRRREDRREELREALAAYRKRLAMWRPPGQEVEERPIKHLIHRPIQRSILSKTRGQ